MSSGPECRLSHADDRNGELGMSMSTQTRPPIRVQVDKTVDHEQSHPGNAAQDGPQRREFPQIELTRTVRRHVGHQRDMISHHPREPGIGRYDSRRPGTARGQIVNIGGDKNTAAWTRNGSHPSKNAPRRKSSPTCVRR